jgi:hypothetical protein
MNRLTQFACYFGCGALTHAYFLGATFNPVDMWSWGYLLAWWIVLLVKFFLFAGYWILVVLAAVIFIGAIGLVIWILVDTYQKRRRRAQRLGAN